MKKQMMIKILPIIVLPVIFLLGYFLSTQPTYTYTNLLNNEDLAKLRLILEEVRVPRGQIDELTEVINQYNQTPYPKSLPVGYHETIVSASLYDYTKAIDSYPDLDSGDINCRRAAFMIFRDYITFDKKQQIVLYPSLKEEITLLEPYIHKDNIEKYSALFADYSASQDGSPLSFKTICDERGISFQDNTNIKLITAHVQFMSTDFFKIAHAGIAIYSEPQIIFIEKIDPLLPFQMSFFKTDSDLENYLIGRFAENHPINIFIYEDNLPITGE